MKGDIRAGIDMEITEEHVKNNSAIKLHYQASPYTPSHCISPIVYYFLHQNFNFSKVFKGESNLARHADLDLLK